MSRYLFFVLVLISTFVFSMAKQPVLEAEACLYNVLIETGNQGTNSTATLVFSADGMTVSVVIVRGFPPNSNYSFQFSSTCIKDVCDVTVISDGSGGNWSVESVGVSVYTIRDGQPNPIPFIGKRVSFETLLSPPDSLNATRRTCSNPPDNEEDCVYNVYIQTGYLGTDSNVGLEFSEDGSTSSVGNLRPDGSTSSVGNLRPYGRNGPVYPYFQANSKDFFWYHRPCLPDVSNATLKSDGSGRITSTSWFVESLGVLVYKTRGGKPDPIPFILKTCSFKALLSREGSLTASATECSDMSSAVEIDGVPLGGSRAYDE